MAARPLFCVAFSQDSFALVALLAINLCEGAILLRGATGLLSNAPRTTNGIETMQRVKLDDIDWKILAELQADGRITNVELAKRVGVSAPPCLRRVRALEEAGFVRGYHADLDPKLLGFEVTVFAMVGLHKQAESDLQAFEALVETWPIVRECHMLNGEIDFILKCVAHDLSEFQSFLTENLTSAENVESVKTSLTIRTSKQSAGIPIAPPSTTPKAVAS